MGRSRNRSRNRFVSSESDQPFLDQFENVESAYSTRKISSNANMCIRVRRSSDNSELDIGFDENEMDVSALVDFVGANDGFVSVWYDQSGNGNDVNNIDTADQPIIVNAGSVEQTNLGRKNALFFNGTTQKLINNSISLNQPFAIHALVDVDSDDAGIFSSLNSSVGIYGGGTRQYVLASDNSLLSQPNMITNNDQIISCRYDGLNGDLSQDALTNVGGNVGSSSIDGFQIGDYSQLSGRQLRGHVSELVIFNSAENYQLQKEEIGKSNYSLKNEMTIYLIGGQSNADGRVPITDPNTPSYIEGGELKGVICYNGRNISKYRFDQVGLIGNGTGDTRAFEKWGFSDVAMRQISLKENAVVCRYSVGNSFLTKNHNSGRSWNADIPNIDPGAIPVFPILVGRLFDFTIFLDAYGINYSVEALIWHQGETDDALTESGDDPNAANDYEQNWSEFITALRLISSSFDLKIIYGTISEDSANYNLTIKSAQLDTADSDLNAFCRDNTDLTLLDSVHFDANSSIEFGEWVANQL